MEDIQNDEMEQPKTLVQHALRFGILLGMIGAILTLLLYVINPALMINMWYGLSALVVFFGMVIYGGISYRKEIGGYIDFGPAYVHGFVTFIIIGIIGSVVNLLLYTVIDPTLPETLVEASIEQQIEILRWFGPPGGAAEQAIDEQRPKLAEQFTVIGVLISFAYSLISYAIITLITGLIVRRKEKVSDVV